MDKLAFRVAEKYDALELKELYTECFSDTNEYIDYFYSSVFPHITTFIGEYDNKIISMLSLFDSQLVIDGKILKAKYVYGVCTKKEFRGQQISKRLLNFVKTQLFDCDALVIIPATISLFEFYKKQGFFTCFFLTNSSFSVSPKNEIPISPCSNQEFLFLRNEFLNSLSLYSRLSNNQLLLNEANFLEANFITATVDGKKGYCVCYKINQKVFIKEHSFGESLKMLLPSLCAYFNLTKFEVREVPKKNITPYGMLYWLKNPHKLNSIGYMNMFLD